MAAAQTSRVLGHYLIAAGAIPDAELQAALEEQRRTRERLGSVLIRRGLAPEHVARALAEQLRLSYAAAPLVPEAAALRLIDGALAARLRVLPLRCTERSLTVAMAEPLDLGALDDLRFRTGRRIEACVAVPAAVDSAIASAYHTGALDAVLTRIAADAPRAPAVEEGELRRASESAPIVALVDLMLTRSVQLRASDVHVEPARVRARVDGVLRELMAIPPGTRGAVVSRIKILAGLDIATKRKPQDGRGSVRVGDREFALRVSTLPANGGEKVVLRLLESSGRVEPLESLGMAPDHHQLLLRLLERSHGLILVTGPTGSGKTTTLYSALAALDRERRNILTLEDPIEYRLPGLTQVQVNRRAGLGFASALRAALRQDPDVIMVGELRDRRSVQIALAAALTGHLVLSTLHTNDASAAVARLVEMGAPPYLVAATVVGVVAQRLARRLCPHCRVDVMLQARTLLELGLPPRGVNAYVPRGCSRCDGVGYRGRVGVFELLPVTGEVRDRVVRRGSSESLRDAARTMGVRSLGEDAWRKVRSGATSLEEVRPLLRVLSDESPACSHCGSGLRASYAACPGCGRTLRVRCECGQLAEPGWRNCTECGRTLNGTARSAGAAAESVRDLAQKSVDAVAGSRKEVAIGHAIQSDA